MVVSLRRPPQASPVNVTFAFAPTNTAAARVTPGSVVFTGANWSTPVQLRVTAVNNVIRDGTRAVTLVTRVASDDAGYKSLVAHNISVTVRDNDVVGGC